LIVSESGLSCAFSAFACGPGGIDGSPGRTSDLYFERTEGLARLNEGHVAAARVSRRLPLVDQEDHVLRIAANEVERSSTSGASTVAAGTGVRSNLAKFVDAAPGRVANPRHLRAEIDGGNIDHARLASADQLEAVVLAPNVATDKRGIELP
jgi:hypothetical protein